VLLLRRSERARFVPGGYVFPGGLVETADASPDVTALIGGLSAEALADRLGLRGAYPPATAYVVAAVRETFEESGLLVGARGDEDDRALALRRDLHEELIAGRPRRAVTTPASSRPESPRTPSRSSTRAR
jgi:8-oxo-dGTP pyrophosphatase MutT (NUDIX family)